MRFTGIDIAKDTFGAAYPQLNGYKTQVYNNDLKGSKKNLLRILYKWPTALHLKSTSIFKYNIKLVYNNSSISDWQHPFFLNSHYEKVDCF